MKNEALLQLVAKPLESRQDILLQVKDLNPFIKENID